MGPARLPGSPPCALQACGWPVAGETCWAPAASKPVVGVVGANSCVHSQLDHVLMLGAVSLVGRGVAGGLVMQVQGAGVPGQLL